MTKEPNYIRNFFNTEEPNYINLAILDLSPKRTIMKRTSKRLT